MICHGAPAKHLLFTAYFLTWPILAWASDLHRQTFSEPHMGTMVHITLYAADRDDGARAAAAAFERIDDLNTKLSDYDPASELSLLCETPAGEAVPVSDDLFLILEQAQDFSRRFDGAFDVTVGALSRSWREARRTQQLPSPMVLQALLKVSGHDQLLLDSTTQSVTRKNPDVRIDLGGIAKGYASSEALRILREKGFPRALVAVGGDLAIGDAPPDRPGWRVGLTPLGPDAPVLLERVYVSTSGDKEQFVEIDGVRYSHILDPRTGIGLTNQVTVTVLAREGARADALATAVSVLGQDDGIRLIESLPDAEVLILPAGGGAPKASSGFRRFLVNP